MNRMVLAVIIILPLVGVVVLIASLWRLPWTPLRLAGLALTIAGFSLLTLARLQLGNAFSIRPKAQYLVQTGIYSRIRHPVYLFGLLALAGVILYVGRPAYLLLLAPLAGMQLLRARREDAVLRAKFGEDYERYRRETWF